jgi:hypothetical protein
LEDTLELSGLGMVFEELEILAYQAMGEAGGDTDLINREGSLVEEGNTGELLDVALNGESDYGYG